MSSINKFRRILTLLQCLQSGRKYSTTQLMGICDVSRRTIFRDIKLLQDAGVEILYDSTSLGYWLPGQWLLPATHLSLSETLSLLLLTQEAGRVGHSVPFMETARTAALKLQSSLPSHLIHDASTLTSAIAIETEPLADLCGQKEYYDQILEAISHHQKIRITYDSFAESKVIRTLLDPYQLLFRRHTWYVIGRSSLHRAVRTFHLGQVQETQLTSLKFEIPPRFNLKRYFGNAWNLIRERESRSQIWLRFQPLVARNVAEVLWHHSQELTWNADGTLDFRALVDGINEMSWWVLGYGQYVEVLEPESLRNLIRERSQAMHEMYSLKKTKRRKR